MQPRRSPAKLAFAVFACALAALLAWLWTDPLAVPESAALGAAPVREAPALDLEPAQQAQGDAAPDPAQAPDEPVEPPEPTEEQREEVAPLAKPPSTARGTVRGKISPAPGDLGAFALAARGGVLPLDCAAIGWPVDPDDPAPEPVRRVAVASDGSFDLGAWSPGPLRLLVLPSPSALTVGRLERDDLWVLAGDTDLGTLQLPAASELVARWIGPKLDLVQGVQLFLAPQRLTGPVRALGWAACSPLTPLATSEELSTYVLPRGRSTLLALAPGCAPTWLEVDRLRDSERELLFQLAPEQSIQGELIDVDGLGLGGARVGGIALRAPLLEPAEARAAGVPAEALASYRTAQADGALRFTLGGLEPGDALLLRAVGGDRLDRTDAFAPEVVAFAGDTGVELERRTGAELAFEVQDGRTGEPVEPFRALLVAASDPDGTATLTRRFPVSSAVWSEVRPPRRSANPLFEDLPESDDLTLWIEAEGFTGSVGLPFRLRTGDRLELGPLQIAPNPALHLRVVDAQSGEPIEGARCELQPVSPFGREEAVGASTDRKGRARLAPVLDLAHELYVKAPEHAPWRSRTLPPSTSADAPWTVELARAGELRVTVLDAEQKPVRAEVLRRRFDAELAPHEFEAYERALTDIQGVAEFSGVEPGLASVAARALVRSDLDLPAAPEVMTWFSVGVAAQGVSSIEVSATPALTLALEVDTMRAPLAHALVRLAPDPDAFRDPHLEALRLEAWPTARTDSQGRAVFEGLPARDYAVRVEHPALDGFGRGVVRLEPKSQVAHLWCPAAQVRGVVVDGEGNLLEDARVVAWALGPLWDEELELEPRTTLQELAPAPIVFSEFETDEEGRFVLSGPPGVQTVITAHDGKRRLTGDYWLEELSTVRQEEPIQVVTGDTARLYVRLARRAGTLEPRFPGVVALCLDQPWGRGVVAQPLEGDQLVLDDVPQGRWKLCVVELSNRSVILEVGSWGWVDELPQDEVLWLTWP